MDNRIGLAQAMAGAGSPPPNAPRQMQGPDDAVQQILQLVTKISDQLDALMETEQQNNAPAAGAPNASDQ